MGFDYSATNITPGRTIPVRMVDLPKDKWPDPESPDEWILGDHPIAHIEMFGLDNRTWITAQIDSADPKKAPAAPTKQKKPEKVTVEKFLENTTEGRAKRRADLIHAVRRIECRHRDGTPATDADIPMWIESLPHHVVDRLWTIAQTQELFYDGNQVEPKVIAEK